MNHENCSDPHCMGIPLAGAFWDAREAFITHYAAHPEVDGAETFDQLFTNYLVATTPYFDNALEDLLAVDDDDDGDWTNGTAHSELLTPAFVGRGWSNPYGEGGLNVMWDGVPGEPIAGVDYLVNSGGCEVQLITTEVDTGEGYVPVARWIIGKPRIGGVAEGINGVCTEWSGSAHNVTVQIGDPYDDDYSCGDVGFVDVPAQDAADGTTYTNIELYLDGSLTGGAECDAATSGAFAGKGGRIAGTIAGSAYGITAKAIGLGEDTAGSLVVGSELGTTNLGELTAESVLDALYGGPVLIAGDLDGILSLFLVSDLVAVGGDLNGTLDFGQTGNAPDMREAILVGGELNGAIRVGGNLLGPRYAAAIRTFGIGASTGSILVEKSIGRSAFLDAIVMAGDMQGEILADYDSDGDGRFDGGVYVSGVFDGNICGANLGPYRPLWEHFEFGALGPEFTVCDGPVAACDTVFTGPDSGAWQDAANWGGDEPDGTKTVCIPIGKTVRVVNDDPAWMDVEAGALHVIGGPFSHDLAGVLVLESATSLTLNEDSSITGRLEMEHGSTLFIASDLKITGDGGEIVGSYDSGQGQSAPVIRDAGGGAPTLTLEGWGADADSSLLVHGSLTVWAALDNNAFVVADGPEPLRLSMNPKTTSVLGHWTAQGDPLDIWGGELKVDTEVTGIGDWELTTHPNARITVNAPCLNLGGVVELRRGTLDLRESFWTTGNISMRSINGSTPRIDIAQGKSARFGN